MNKTININHEQINLSYIESDMGLWQAIINPDKEHKDLTDPVPLPNFQLAVAGIPHGFMPALVSGVTDIPRQMKMTDFRKTDEMIMFSYKHEALGLVVEIEMRLIKGSSTIRQITKVRNEGNEPVIITHLSSAAIQGVATDGLRQWYDKQKVKVHYCLQTWEGEGQWRCSDLEELGLYPTSVHQCAGTVRFSSIGSFSTARYLPMTVIEDRETGKSWYMQVECSGSWNIEIGYRHLDSSNTGGLFLHAGGPSERYGSWSKRLMPGECYTTVPVAFGCCIGGFAEAVRELTKYRRSSLKPANAWQGECPVFFNDYMNCLWGNPTKENLIPLIDAASEVGCEGFCIDAGWFGKRTNHWGFSLGDWEPSTDRFGDEGLKGIIDYIKRKQMIPGIWLEMEVCGEKAELGKKSDEWFIRRRGKRVGGGSRWFLDFTKPQVREYMHGVIARLIDLGIGFIKNDYNECIGLGEDTLSDSPAEGLLIHLNAFCSFIDEIRNKYPKLILENCGSGAMRQDYGMLSHFHMQSTSDQEFYHKYPSILGGALAGILPEQAGIWVYPYPLLYEKINHPEILYSPEYRAMMEDGEQTIFNMINGMCGNLYLSGHIDAADELNKELIKEAIDLYKKERKFIHNSYPIWPIGFTRINDEKTWAVVGLENEDKTRTLIAVWRLRSSEDIQEIPLHHLQGKCVDVKQIYPADGFESKCYYSEFKGCLVVQLAKNYQARLFEVMIKQ